MLGADELAQISGMVENGGAPIDLPETLQNPLLWKGLLLTLKLDGSRESVSLLEKVAIGPFDQEIGELAVRFLGDLGQDGNGEAVKTLYELAIDYQNTQSVAFIKSHPSLEINESQKVFFFFLYGERQEYLERDPHQEMLTGLFFSLAPSQQTRALKLAKEKSLNDWALIVGAVQDPALISSLIEKFPQFQKFEQSTCIHLFDQRAHEENRFAAAICQIFIFHDNQPAKLLALEKGHLPGDPIQASLFLFLAEEWPRYEQIDFSHRLLMTAYETASQPIRRKILALSRASGQIDWLKNLSSVSRMRWLNELTDPEWEATIQALTGAKRFEDLWLLAQSAPPLWSGKILNVLKESQWFPGEVENRDGFARLLDLAQACRENVYSLTPLSIWQSPAHEITCIALDASGSNMVAGNSQTSLLRWRITDDLAPQPTLFSAAPGTYSIRFSPDGEYLAIACGDHKIRVLNLSRGMIVKTLEGHKGLVRSLAFEPEGRFLYSASFDGTIQAWRFPNGMRTNTIQVSKQELFELAISADGKFLLCSGAEPKIRVYSLPQSNLARSLEGHFDTVTLLTAAPKGTLAASFGRDLKLKFWNFASGKETASLNLKTPIASLVIHPNEKFILGGGMQGDIGIWSFPNGQHLHTLKSISKPVVGMGLVENGSQLISASTGGEICRWDLSVLLLSRTPVELILGENDKIARKLKNQELAPGEKPWLEFIGELIRWRKRFDIEVGEMHPVLQIGEFDIEL